MSARSVGNRDLRLDLFRGLALWFIFIDHIPGNELARLTFRNFGFSDATEIFVFIAGYTAAMVYGNRLEQQGFGVAFWQLMRRVWQLYAAHILLFVLYVAQISWVAGRFSNPVLLDVLNVNRFLDDPGRALIDALVLNYRPTNLDILPLYMALLLAFPLCLALLRRSAWITFAASALLYAGVQVYGWAWPIYADGTTWYFNPLGWQFLFVLGALLARSPTALQLVRWRDWLGGCAALYLVFSLLVVLSWTMPALEALMPDRLAELLYPIDKSNLHLLRLLHFLAVAYLVRHWIGPDHPLLHWRAWLPVIRCGQHSLPIFCLGISLSFAAYFVLVQFGSGLAIQLLVVVAGLLIMSAAAQALHLLRHEVRTTRT